MTFWLLMAIMMPFAEPDNSSHPERPCKIFDLEQIAAEEAHLRKKYPNNDRVSDAIEQTRKMFSPLIDEKNNLMKALPDGSCLTNGTESYQSTLHALISVALRPATQQRSQ